MKPIFVMPHYIATDELRDLAIQALTSMRERGALVVSVDDGSPLDASFLDNHSDHTIHRRTNGGFAVACNTGLKWALRHGYEYIGCANNDIRVFDGWLQALTYPFTRFDKVGITGLISSKEQKLEGKPLGEYIIPKITDGGYLNHWMMSGGLWLSSREALTDVGLFDEQFKVGGEEDIDLFWRMAEKGYRTVMSGYSCFWHKEGATRWNDTIRAGFANHTRQAEHENIRKLNEKWEWDIIDQGLRFHEDILEENGVARDDVRP